MTRAQLRQLAVRERARRERVGTGRPTFTLAAFAGKHADQLAAMQDRAPWQHWMCARQSGKSFGCDGVLLDNALASPRSTNLLLGLKGTGVRTNNWEPIWRRITDGYVPSGAHNETRMLTAMPNGARVMFAGTDDLSNVKKYLGNRLDHGVVIIDEAQDQPEGVLTYLLRVLLPPMLTPTSRVILAGVLPDVPAGMFLSLADWDEATKSGGNGPGWAHHSWGRAANVHTPEAMQQLRDYLKAHGLTMDDPQIQRDWFMQRVWDAGATAYRYDRARAGYEGAPPDGLTEYSVGIDPGTRDRTAIQVWGWGKTVPDVYHVHEWVTERNANTTWSQIAEQLKIINQRFRPHAWYYDAGGSKMTLDLFLRDYGVPVVHAAVKSDLPGQVARMADLLALGRAKIMIGSALEADLLRARWDADARAKGLYRWSSVWHPDAADAARYGLRAYLDEYEKPRTPEQAKRQAYLERVREAEESVRAARAAATGYDPGDFSDGELTDDLYQ